MLLYPWMFFLYKQESLDQENEKAFKQLSDCQSSLKL